MAENMLASFLPDICDSSPDWSVSGYGCMVSHIGGLPSWVFAWHSKFCRKVRANAGAICAGYSACRVHYLCRFFLPMFVYLRDHSQSKKLPAGTTYWHLGISRLSETYHHAQRYRDLFTLLTTISLYMRHINGGCFGGGLCQASNGFHRQRYHYHVHCL